MPATAVIPVLRSFDRATMVAFYIDFLGFDLVFEHRHEPGLPLYAGLRLGGCEVHLTEHYGDAAPGATLRFVLDDVDAWLAGLPAHPNAAPSVTRTPWGTREARLADPSGNRLVFVSPQSG